MRARSLGFSPAAATATPFNLLDILQLSNFADETKVSHVLKLNQNFFETESEIF